MPTKNYPLFLSCKFPMMGNGFSVLITLRGRLLLEESKGEVWAYGVNPGGISASGENIDDAMKAFTSRLNDLAKDIATAAQTPESFRTEMEEHFQTNEEYAEKWETARKAVREGQTELPGLPKDNGSSGHSISVEQVVNPNPTMNPSEKYTLAKAA